MPGIAYFEFGFYNSSNGYVWDLEIDKPLPAWPTLQMRHAYYAAVSWVDYQIGRVLSTLDDLGLTESTIVVFHSDHGFQLGKR